MDNTDALQWLYDGSDNVVMVAASVLGIFVILGICTRLGRLRSLAKMSGFDFGVNVAVGSIIASAVLSPDPSLFRAGVALAVIFALQIAYSFLRRKVPGLLNPSSQPPHVVWANGGFIEKNMRATMFTETDIFHAMRSAGVNNFKEVRFVIAEATGDVNVYTRSQDGPLSPEIFEGVVGRELLTFA